MTRCHRRLDRARKCGASGNARVIVQNARAVALIPAPRTRAPRYPKCANTAEDAKAPGLERPTCLRTTRQRPLQGRPHQINRSRTPRVTAAPNPAPMQVRARWQSRPSAFAALSDFLSCLPAIHAAVLLGLDVTPIQQFLH